VAAPLLGHANCPCFFYSKNRLVILQVLSVSRYI
jgi:hypothetical protein